MPSNIVKSFAKKTGKSEQDIEKLWDKAKEEGQEDNYAYIIGILKKMLGLQNESFQDYVKRLKRLMGNLYG